MVSKWFDSRKRSCYLRKIISLKTWAAIFHFKAYNPRVFYICQKQANWPTVMYLCDLTLESFKCWKNCTYQLKQLAVAAVLLKTWTLFFFPTNFLFFSLKKISIFIHLSRLGKDAAWILLHSLLAKNSDSNHCKIKISGESHPLNVKPCCPERHMQHIKIAGGLDSILLLSSLRSDPFTCAWSQRGFGLHLDLPGQPLWGQHWLAAADDPESQGGTVSSPSVLHAVQSDDTSGSFPAVACFDASSRCDKVASHHENALAVSLLWTSITYFN